MLTLVRWSIIIVVAAPALVVGCVVAFAIISWSFGQALALGYAGLVSADTGLFNE